MTIELSLQYQLNFGHAQYLWPMIIQIIQLRKLTVILLSVKHDFQSFGKQSGLREDSFDDTKQNIKHCIQLIGVIVSGILWTTVTVLSSHLEDGQIEDMKCFIIFKSSSVLRPSRFKHCTEFRIDTECFIIICGNWFNVHPVISLYVSRTNTRSQ